ncbi:hypothetical protein AB6A23_18595 [Paenibacillus tarimensis]
MIGMKVRYDIGKINLKIRNVTLPDADDSYVLLTATDEHKNEIVFSLSHEQAQHLENELYEANRRWKEYAVHARSSLNEEYAAEPDNENKGDRVSH